MVAVAEGTSLVNAEVTVCMGLAGGSISGRSRRRFCSRAKPVPRCSGRPEHLDQARTCHGEHKGLSEVQRSQCKRHEHQREI